MTAASVADHSTQPPQRHEADGSPSWITRGANFVVVVTRAAPGCRLVAAEIPDEHMVLLPEAGARFETDGGAWTVAGYTLAIVPPGSSTVTAEAAGWIVRCFSARCEDLLQLAGNAADYATPPAGVAPLVEWPAPAAGFALRTYDLRDALQDGDKTRCYRSANMMVNVLRERRTPRDVAALSPHAHDDFEQGSIALSGRYIHHLRTPWGADMRRWRPDEAIEVGSPSVTVIPPPIVHTTRNVGDEPALLVDLFCPPRLDFARRPGMVRNAADYPMPLSDEGLP